MRQCFRAVGCQAHTTQLRRVLVHAAPPTAKGIYLAERPARERQALEPARQVGERGGGRGGRQIRQRVRHIDLNACVRVRLQRLQHPAVALLRAQQSAASGSTA